jgi:uncharacterized protein YpmB
MRKKLIMLAIITVLAVVIASLGACTKATTTNQTSTTTTSATTSIATATSTTTKATTTSTEAQTTAVSSTTTSTGNGLTDLLGKAATVAYYSCQVSITDGTNTENMNEWVKTGNPAKLRMEITAAGQTTDIIYDGQNYYMYMPSANIAYQMSVTAAQQYTANSGDTSSLTQYNPVLVGPDTVNGMACTVYQYTVQGVSTKIWIWNQYGLPVQMVSGTTTIVYSNYSFSSIADSEFQLPAGVTVTTMPVIPTTTP